MQLSTRNVLPGTVVSITEGAVNTEVAIEIAPNVEIVSIITKQAYESLKLTKGAKAFAAIKAPNVMIATE